MKPAIPESQSYRQTYRQGGQQHPNRMVKLPVRNCVRDTLPPKVTFRDGPPCRSYTDKNAYQQNVCNS